MAGTQQLVEVSPDLIAQTLLTIASDEKNSVEGIDISGLQNGATCYVRVLDRVYRYYQFSVVAVAPPTVIAPAAGLAFGRWILQPGSGSTVVGGCPTVYTVAPDGSGTYPTVELAIAAANTNATAALGVSANSNIQLSKISPMPTTDALSLPSGTIVPAIEFIPGGIRVSGAANQTNWTYYATILQ
jgi:hypothetical protein